MNLDSALAELRKAVDVSSQAIIASEMEVEPSAVSRWLSGTSRPTGRKLVTLIEWAERSRLRREAPIPSRVAEKRVPYGAPPSLDRLAGYAEALGLLLEQAAENQRRILDGLNAQILVAQTPTAEFDKYIEEMPHSEAVLAAHEARPKRRKTGT